MYAGQPERPDLLSSDTGRRGEEDGRALGGDTQIPGTVIPQSAES